jgi:hypothetical protein
MQSLGAGLILFEVSRGPPKDKADKKLLTPHGIFNGLILNFEIEKWNVQRITFK